MQITADQLYPTSIINQHECFLFQNPINKFNRLEPAVDPYPVFGGTALFAHGP